MLLILVAAVSVASADACREGVLKAVVKEPDQGDPFVLVLRSGERYRVYGQDFIDPRRWRRGDHLKVCPDGPPAVRITDENRDEALLAEDLQSQPPRTL